MKTPFLIMMLATVAGFVTTRKPADPEPIASREKNSANPITLKGEPAPPFQLGTPQPRRLAPLGQPPAAGLPASIRVDISGMVGTPAVGLFNGTLVVVEAITPHHWYGVSSTGVCVALLLVEEAPGPRPDNPFVFGNHFQISMSKGVSWGPTWGWNDLRFPCDLPAAKSVTLPVVMPAVIELRTNP